MSRDKPLANLPAPLAAEFARMGKVWGTDINAFRKVVVDAYTPILETTSRDGIEVARDVAYGPDPRQVLDIYSPTGQEKARGVVVFVHGGAFIRGAKSFNGYIYDNVPTWFARQGFVAVNMEYRLAPGAPYPSGAQDVASATRWIHEHISDYQGDPDRIHLIGHSAGGTHVAAYCFDDALKNAVSGSVQSAILISARLTADAKPGNPNAKAVAAYFGDDESRYEALSPMAHAANVDIPTMIVVAEFENPGLDVYGLEFGYRVAQAGKVMPRFIQVLGHNHTSIVAHFDTGEDYLGNEIVSFIERAEQEKSNSTQGSL